MNKQARKDWVRLTFYVVINAQESMLKILKIQTSLSFKIIIIKYLISETGFFFMTALTALETKKSHNHNCIIMSSASLLYL